MKKYIISGLVALALIVSVGTTARAEGQVTIAELQAQIRQLMSLLQTLLAQQNINNNPTQVQNETASKLTIANVVGKAAGDFEIDLNSNAYVSVKGIGTDPKMVKVYVGGIESTVTQASGDYIYFNTPTGGLVVGSIYDLYLTKGTQKSNTVRVKIISKVTRATVPNTCKIDKNLSLQDSGDDVNELQKFLIKNGYSSGVSNTTGVYGVNTKIGVEAFQRAKGITNENGVGERTRAAINALINCEPEASANVASFVKVITPNGGDTYNVGDSVKIDFTTNLTEKNSSGISLQLYKYKGGNGFPYEYVSTIKSGTREAYNWIIPILPSGQYVIYAVGENVMANGVSIADFSDKPFTILPVGAAGGASVIQSLGSLILRALDF